jgi:hypothetical protein
MLYLPTEQSSQLSSLVCPVLVWYFPREQLTQSPGLTLEVSLEYFPAGQGRQLELNADAATRLYLPAKQSSHDVDAAEDS